MIGLGSDKKLAGGGGGWISSRSGWLLELLTELTKDPRNACSTSTLPWLKLHCSKGMDKSCVPYILIISLLTERIPSLCWRAKQTWARRQVQGWTCPLGAHRMHFCQVQRWENAFYTFSGKCTYIVHNVQCVFYCSSLRKKKQSFAGSLHPVLYKF